MVVHAFLALACAARALIAQNPVPAQIEVSPPNTVNLDPTARLEFSGGHSTTFLIQNLGNGPGDARVLFSCATFGSVAAVTCPAPIWLQPGGDTLTVTVTATMGGAVGAAWITLTATPDPHVISGTGNTGRRDFNVVPAAATWSPASIAVTRARGTSGSQTLTLTNTGQLETTYDIRDVQGACPVLLAACNRTPARSNPLPVSSQQQVTVDYTTVGAGVSTLNLDAMLVSHLVARAPIVVTVVDASVADQPSIAVPSGAMAFSYTGFVVSNAPGGPGATYDVSIATCSGVTACRFSGGVTTTQVSLSSSVPAQALQLFFDVPAVADSGAVSIQVAYAGTVLSTGSLDVRMVKATISPSTATTTASSGSTGNQYAGFTVTSGPNSPQTVLRLNFGTCTVVVSCRFIDGNPTLDVPFDPGATAAVPVLYNAPTSGSGTVVLRVQYLGFTLATATLSVTVSSATNSATVVATGTLPNVVGPGATGRSQSFTLTNTGPAATFSFAQNCSTMPAPAAAVSCSTPPPVGPLATSASANMVVNFTGGSTQGVQSSLTLQALVGGSLVASGNASIVVPNALVTPPAPLTVINGATRTASYSVTNLGPGTVQYFLSVVCTGGVANCQVTSGGIPPLPLGGSSQVTLSFSGSSVGTGTVSLEARLYNVTGPVIATGVASGLYQISV